MALEKFHKDSPWLSQITHQHSAGFLDISLAPIHPGLIPPAFTQPWVSSSQRQRPGFKPTPSKRLSHFLSHPTKKNYNPASRLLVHLS